jgi:hypothetical protein
MERRRTKVRKVRRRKRKNKAANKAYLEIKQMNVNFKLICNVNIKPE